MLRGVDRPQIRLIYETFKQRQRETALSRQNIWPHRMRNKVRVAGKGPSGEARQEGDQDCALIVVPRVTGSV